MNNNYQEGRNRLLLILCILLFILLELFFSGAAGLMRQMQPGFSSWLIRKNRRIREKSRMLPKKMRQWKLPKQRRKKTRNRNLRQRKQKMSPHWQKELSAGGMTL